MAKSKLGAKVVCGDCGVRFYDLTRQEPKCPKCGAVYKIKKVAKPKKKKELEPKVVPVKDDVDGEETESDDDALLLQGEGEDEDDLDSNEASEIMEDTSDLAGDDDISGVAVNRDDSDEDQM